MEEITTRFEIIRLAAKLGDTETIEVQTHKLRATGSDGELDEILSLLDSHNYRQALYRMKHYAQSLEESFEEASSAGTKSRKRKKKNESMGLFDLDDAQDRPQSTQRVLTVEDILKISRENLSERVEEYRSLGEEPASGQEAPDQEAAQVESTLQELASGEDTEAEKGGESSGSAEQEFNLDKALSSAEISEEAHGDHGDEESSESEKSFEEEWNFERTRTSLPGDAVEERGSAEAASEVALASTGSAKIKRSESRKAKAYAPISYIEQKFRNMFHQFPPLQTDSSFDPELISMQKKIAKEGYSEEEIAELLKRYEAYKEQGEKAKSAQYLLLAAATESQFAQFMLARELFRGDVITQDHPEAFTQINSLADQNFPEAICDLAQLYEYGIGIGKDRKMALLLYEEAAEMGVERARMHYERLKDSEGILGALRKITRGGKLFGS